MTSIEGQPLTCARCGTPMESWHLDARLFLADKPLTFGEKVLCVCCQISLRAWFAAGAPLDAEEAERIITEMERPYPLDMRAIVGPATPRLVTRAQRPHALPRVIK